MKNKKYKENSWSDKENEWCILLWNDRINVVHNSYNKRLLAILGERNKKKR